jgi:hypothetical protein
MATGCWRHRSPQEIAGGTSSAWLTTWMGPSWPSFPAKTWSATSPVRDHWPATLSWFFLFWFWAMRVPARCSLQLPVESQAHRVFALLPLERAADVDAPRLLAFRCGLHGRVGKEAGGGRVRRSNLGYLNRLGSGVVVCFMAGKGLAPILHDSRMLASEMTHFVKEVQYYLLFEVRVDRPGPPARCRPPLALDHGACRLLRRCWSPAGMSSSAACRVRVAWMTLLRRTAGSWRPSWPACFSLQTARSSFLSSLFPLVLPARFRG